MTFESKCADCGGYDIEWMYRCHKHGLEYCRGCSCPECADEDCDDEYAYDDGDDEPCDNKLAHDAHDEVPCPDCGKLP